MQGFTDKTYCNECDRRSDDIYALLGAEASSYAGRLCIEREGHTQCS